MSHRVERNWTLFWVVAAIMAIAFVALARLPESLVAQMTRNRPFFDTSAQADWAYRILVIVAGAQAIYGAFSVLQVDRVRRAMDADPRLSLASRQRVLVVVTRTAAGMILLTLVYGFVAFWFTGQRGGFWLFAFIAVVQLLWYLRQVSSIAGYLDWQKDPVAAPADDGWHLPSPDYSPPIARGLGPPNTGSSV
ncbi:MAG: hypothetical protein M3285_12140 [Actinomycetota bacterium]|nr:hypothetical protein [Actinomycetota bacterium]